MSTPLPVLPLHRAIVAVDIEGSTNRTNRARAMVRSAMYDLLEEALRLSYIEEPDRDLIDRGDGVLVLIRPLDHLPKTALLTTFIPTLTDLLTQHGADRPDQKFRLRAAMHAGDVHFDQKGWYGEDIDITVRLLDAPEVKRRLRQTDAPLVLVVSQEIYRSVIRHGYDGIDHTAFERIVQVQIAGERLRGWVQMPGQAGGQDLTA